MAETEALPAGQPAEDSDGSNNEKVFNFFGLPAELRNIIYSMMTENSAIDGFNNLVRPFARRRDTKRDVLIVEGQMLITCLLLNHQFKDEYEAQVQPSQHFIFQGVTYNMVTVHLSGVASKINRFTFHLACNCDPPGSGKAVCHCERDVQYHENWMKELFRQCKAIKEVKFKIYSKSVCAAGSYWRNHVVDVSKRLRQLVCPSVKVGLESYIFSDDDWGLPASYSSDCPLAGKWVEGRGWQWVDGEAASIKNME